TIHHLFQIARTVAKRLLKHPAVMNVGTGAIPFRDLSIVANGNRTSPEPAVSSFLRSESIFRFVVCPRFNTAHPIHNGLLLVIGMHVVEPSETIRRTRSGAGKVIETVTDIVPGAVRSSAEDNVWRGADNGIELQILPHQLGVHIEQQFGLASQLLGALRNTLLQFAIQRFQLSGLAV